MYHDIYDRAHTVVKRYNDNRTDDDNNQKPNHEPRWPDHALVFDCESRITADQTLTFGFWRFCELRNGEYLPLEEGIFHDDDGIAEKEFDLLRKYARNTSADTTDDGNDRLRLYSRKKFVCDVFGIAI